MGKTLSIFQHITHQTHRHREKKKILGEIKQNVNRDAVLPRGENMNELSNSYIFHNFAKFGECVPYMITYTNYLNQFTCLCSM